MSGLRGLKALSIGGSKIAEKHSLSDHRSELFRPVIVVISLLKSYSSLFIAPYHAMSAAQTWRRLYETWDANTLQPKQSTIAIREAQLRATLKPYSTLYRDV